MEEYYDEDEDHRLQWVRTGFYTSLSIGVMALCSLLFLKEWVYDIFIVIYTAFYVYMVSRFLNYRNNEVKFVLPAVTRETGTAEKEKCHGQETRNPRIMTEREQKFKIALEEWIKEKKFSEKDIGVEEIARSLGTDSSFLRYYFRTYMKNDFRTWRSELRIREAQRVLDQNPHVALSRVCETVGFYDKGNFHRQFQKITGTTPANYRQGCCERISKGQPRAIRRPLSVGSLTGEHAE
jgi:YesN/AraC family two-component response regulator